MIELGIIAAACAGIVGWFCHECDKWDRDVEQENKERREKREKEGR